MTPVMVANTPLVESSLPRRFISRLMRNEDGIWRWESQARLLLNMGSCGIWNIRGLNNTNKQLEIKIFLSQNKVGLFGLLETKIKNDNWNKVRVNLCDDWSICTNSSLHKGRRILLIWDPNSFNVEAERIPLWDSLRQYQKDVRGPWIVGGDFNAIMAINERIRGALITNAEMAPLAHVVQDCQSEDLGARGSIYTWTNTHEYGTKVYIRLDRVMVNVYWVDMLPDSYVHYLPEGLFDHCPGLIHFVGEFQTLLVQDPLNEELCLSEIERAKDLVELKIARDQYLRQKAKCEWIKSGDDNTAYFHAQIKRRRARNRVLQIKDMDNTMWTKPEDIQNAFEQYYKILLGTSTEVTSINKRIVAAVKGMFQSGPIACCNTIYKCLSKVLCARLGQVLPDVISTSQSAFIKVRDIIGNIFICQDLIKLYKRKSCSPRLMMKLDLQKAYDSFEWSFVEGMLEAMGFPANFTQFFMQCMTTSSYSLALNGSIFGLFKGQRGRRQGDPLSPFIFTICLEYLSRILRVVQKLEKYKFHPLCNRVKLSHLCFADDLILFCKGDRASVKLLFKSFEYFSKASGLVMNKGKSNIYCNGIDDKLIKELELMFGIKRGTVPFKYLGVNVSPKRPSIINCTCLVERVVDRIKSLGSRKLSYAGRVVFIKAVLTNLHSYWGRIFILPKNIIGRIEAVCRAFLWHGTDHKESPALVSWEQI
ncbi:uncharacterized protein LOC141640841 [Silene latifolia]|uniref:uncharacterized protein LOC141640841 n=1 Tax=Silene latifolia TaxID=37657 RepID=UPI003D76AF10